MRAHQSVSLPDPADLNPTSWQGTVGLWTVSAIAHLLPAKSGEFSIGHLVESRGAVDALISAAEGAGATVTDRPHDRPFGIYSGYFQDPDDHLWEIIWNPATNEGA